MKVVKRARQSICGLLLLALLSMQFAVASYACPQWLLAGGDASPSTTNCETLAAGDAMDSGTPLLCKAHCNADDLSTGAQTPADFSAPVLALVVAWFDTLHVEPSSASVAAAFRGVTPPGSPPLYLLHRVFRN